MLRVSPLTSSSLIWHWIRNWGSEDGELIARTDEITELGFPVLVGASRKSFTTEVVDLPPSDRVASSIAAHLIAAANGANIVRVHDVVETVAALRTAESIWGFR
ncbi:dihydropteroate synthase [Haladaptatus halobius]|uniref:dihydropteroate synthase n=1 Tax=Haladaptatus halobius TaxID=2884875 RepID=UPI0034A189E3